MPSTSYYKKTVAGDYYLWVKSSAGILQYIKETDEMEIGTYDVLPSGMSSATFSEWETAANNTSSWLLGGHVAHRPPNG